MGGGCLERKEADKLLEKGGGEYEEIEIRVSHTDMRGRIGSTCKGLHEWMRFVLLCDCYSQVVIMRHPMFAGRVVVGRYK